ncbi:MAG: hypothetical protein II864_06515 [Prevotella sp.]|nr:hypothetical protein [Prevotella sp.]
MKKTYINPTIESVVVEADEQLLSGSITETLDNTDVSSVDDFIQLSREVDDIMEFCVEDN